MKNSGLFLLLLLIITCSCQVHKRLTMMNYAYLYEDDKSMTDLQCMIFHTSDSISTVYFKIDLINLLYEKPSEENSYTARFRIKYELFDSYKFSSLLDSASFDFADSLNYGEEADYIENFTVNAPFGSDYVLNVIITDLNRKVSTSKLFEIYKTNRESRQYFMIKDDNAYPIFSNYIAPDEKVSITYLGKKYTKLSVRYYNRDFPVAQPPFTQNADTKFNYKADSIFDIELSDNETPLLQLPAIGFYHFQVNFESRNGVTLFRFYEDFPDITDSYQAFLPLRYLTSTKEFEEMKLKGDKKMVVDEFWLKTSGNESRAKVLISKYYNNVRRANIFFSSYLEGWKTDRGIIYSVYGPPNLVYKTANTETWTYGERGNMLSVKFTFTKVYNPFSNNDYSLNKAPVYKDNWYMTVETWRR